MIFMDGEAFTRRAEAFAQKAGIELEPGPHYRPGVFYWFPFSYPGDLLCNPEGKLHLKTPPTRSFYYTSASGGVKGVEAAKKDIWKLGFEPKVFRRAGRGAKVKGVEVSLVTDALSNAYNQNYDIAVLVAGDAAYAPLVEELKRLGKIVYVVFFSLEEENAPLQYAADIFLDLDSRFLSHSGGR